MSNSSQAELVQQARTLVEERTGLSSQSQERIDLKAVLDDLSGGDLAGFVQTLRSSPDSSSSWQQLMRALVIGETYFFRHRSHFDLLRTHILQDINNEYGNINIWSAGCATGEETYSVAMTLYESLPASDQSKIRLIGTDINAHALKIARQGVYRAWAFRGTQSDFREQYFDQTNGGFQVKSFIKKLVTFRQTNLLVGPPMPQFHIIFCCNVLLYFKQSAVLHMENLLYDSLVPGGWLILGSAEVMRHHRERWITHIHPGAVVYQKPAPNTIFPAASVPITTYHPPSQQRPSSQRTPQAQIDIQQRYTEVVECFRAKRYDDTERILQSILEVAPNHTAAHTLYACLFANRGQLDEAREHLEIAVQTEPLYADAHYLRGVLLLDVDRETAAESFRSAIYCQRGHALASMILGNLYLQDGNIARARRVWETALQTLKTLPPDSPVSDLSDLTADGIASFLNSQLQDR